MKHIFKKLHKTHNESNRTNETLSPFPPATSSSTSTPQSQQSNSSDHAVSPLASSAASQSAAAMPVSDSGGDSLGSGGVDYFSSEEEFQMQLALAISASNSELRHDPENDQILAAKSLSLGTSKSIDLPRDKEVSGEALSLRYWDFGVLDYGEKVVDGFYDVYSIIMDPTPQGKIPSLAQLETNAGDFGYEAVIVNRAIDPILQELEQVARCIAIDCPPSNIGLFIQRLAELVTDHMGGPVKDANIMLARWVDRSSELRTSLRTSVFPIGSVKPGISRHRALLFKVLADKIGVRCRLMKGNHYTGIEDTAVNIIKLGDEREFLVDLMVAPGALIPTYESNGKHSSSQSDDQMLNKGPCTQVLNDSEVVRSSTKEMTGNNFGISRVSAENRMEFCRNLGVGQAESSSSIVNDKAGAGPSRFSSNSASQFAFPSTSAVESSLYKTNRGALTVGDGVRMNFNVVPYNQDNVNESTNPFLDVNSFQTRGTGRLVQKIPQECKTDESQRQINGPFSGRPPLPMMWKNHHAINEHPRKKEHDFLQGLFPRNNHETNGFNMSSATSSSFSENVIPSTKSTNESSLTCVYKDAGNSKNDVASVTAASRSNRIPLVDARKTSHDISDMTSSMEISAGQQGHDNGLIFLQDHRKCTPDGFMETKLLCDDTGSLSSPINLSSVDPVLDGVGECEIPWEDLVIGERIGFGSYGEVYVADMNGTEVAVKKFLDQEFSGAALDEFKREVRIMRRLCHPNIVLFMGAVTRPPNLSIITEYLPRGSLYHIIHHPNCQISEKRRLKMALDVARGMNCLHSSMPPIVHRDLKSSNLLVDKDWNVKVCDFGLSRLKHNTFLSSKSTAGTPEWMAPEVLRNEPSNEKCDVYSFGVILWELATLKLPWSEMNPMQVVGEVGFRNRHLEIPREVDPFVARIIWECWQSDPGLRPSFAQLCVALKPLQYLTIPSSTADQQSSPLPQEMTVNFA